MVGVGVAPLVVVRSILVIILADEEVDSVAAAAAASFSSAAFVFCYDAFSYSFCWGSWEWRRRKEFLKKVAKINSRSKKRLNSTRKPIRRIKSLSLGNTIKGEFLITSQPCIFLILLDLVRR